MTEEGVAVREIAEAFGQRLNLPVVSKSLEEAALNSQQTFSTSQKLQANGEIVMLQYFQPAHTDTDIYIHFQKANVIHMGDTFFNGFYSVIDASTGGKIDGMIAGADEVLPLADNKTKIVPGHGPLGNKAELTTFRGMLVVARDRVQELKTAGKSADEIAASKPLADLDATWGKGFFKSTPPVADPSEVPMNRWPSSFSSILSQTLMSAQAR